MKFSVGWGAVFGIAVAMAGCERKGPSAHERAERACVADDLPPLQRAWQRRPECTPTNVACRDDCTGGNANACFNLAVALERNEATAERARELFHRACTLGLATGCTNWAATEWTVHHDIPSRCLYRVFQQACDVGDELACGMVGRILIEDRRGAIDLVHGWMQLEQTCAAHSSTCRMLAYYSEQGLFGPADRNQIKELMRRACDGGDEEACGDHATVEETYE